MTHKNLTHRTPKSLLVTFLLALSLFTTACGDGEDGRNIDIAGVDGPTVTLQEDNVLISMVFENMHLQGGLRYNIPKYEKSYMEVSPDAQSDGTLVSFSIALDDVFDSDLQRLDPQALPGGRSIPGVASGRLPAVAFTVEEFHNISVYLGDKLFGLFMPKDSLDIGQSIVTARFYSSGDKVGNISLVGSDINGENSGIFLLLDLDRKTKKKLKRINRWY